MAGKRGLSGDVAREACLKFPNASTRTIANYLLAKESRIFTSYEQARTAARVYRGLKVVGHTGKLASETIPYEPAIPDADDQEVKPYKFAGQGRGLVVSDLHIPYHDKAAVANAIKTAMAEGYTDFCIVNGDMLDFYVMSKFLRDPRLRHFAGELEMGREFLAMLAKEFDRVVYKLGNHEVRYEHYLHAKAPELIGVDDFELKNLMKLADMGVEFVQDVQVIHVGDKLNILHGHEYGSGFVQSVNPARTMFLRTGACSISGHNHKTSNHTEKGVRDQVVSCWSAGCLCGLHPKYAPLNKWDQSFILLEIDGNDFTVRPKKIISGKVF